MPRRWSEHEIEKMLDYRDQGLTEAKIADKLTIIFMRRFTQEAVNRKIRDLKRSGYIEKNEHTGRYSSPTGEKRSGENHKSSKLSRQLGRVMKRRTSWHSNTD